ncbi:TIGR03111 family XrtG-associated glycosyltransferase [Lapidilactobacillus luobeiensis]|uniref:TIGR03111 family XrtG-associated glycosyltransferase n=1 Tax=Lapidilactobacillus luobeiensis TaxID=2950371 RepID=UPI0021C4BB68|nr:TIGR03111 family XrtG-associated glycosyltransferase [Lapidilactobacillus luobeiensis]
MTYFMGLTLTQMGFWLTWALIPLIFEIIPALYSALRLIVKTLAQRWQRQPLPEPEKLPMISVIIPVHNSATTLFACLQSIAESTYPRELIQVILANNQSTDNSFSIYAQAQQKFDLRLQLIETEQGKAKALNAAIYQCIGNYIINIDSDGTLEPHALMNMIQRFENDLDLAAQTGTVLPNRQLIKNSDRLWRRIFQKTEYFEYAQAFLSGRTIESRHNQLFTMSGAFSAFRKETLMQTFLYNTETVGEDTDMTFQIRDVLQKKVQLCADAIFYVEPSADWSSLYLQRQRWQRGESEVTEAYGEQKSAVHHFFKNFLIRRMMVDHTTLFPRMIWLFAGIVLLYFGYSLKILLLSFLLIYCLYVLISLFNFISVALLLRDFPEERRFYWSTWWTIFLLPLYNFVLAWIRYVGIINGMAIPARWNTKKFGDEGRAIGQVIHDDFKRLLMKEQQEDDDTTHL